LLAGILVRAGALGAGIDLGPGAVRAAATGGAPAGSGQPPRVLGLPDATPPAATPPQARAARDTEFSTRYAMRHVRHLAARIGPRVRATKGELRGARYFARKMRRRGYRTKIQRFQVDGRTSRNVVATWPETRRNPFVLGAHIDTVAGSPGANDNASGVGILLDVARIVAGTAKARNLRFVAFGSEEYGSNGIHHVGSQVFVNRLGPRRRARLPGMVSVDMVADGRPLIIGTAGIGPEIVARTLFRRLRRAGFAVVYRTTCDCSDNGPFELAGIPAAFMWTGPEPNYHDPSDTPRNLSRRSLRRSGRAVARFARSLDRRTLRRFVRNR
jgi:aminopeptidase YwaD